MVFNKIQQREQSKTPSAVAQCVARVYDELAKMPHFVTVHDIGSSGGCIKGSGLLNMLNGCFVLNVGEGLQLAWQVDGNGTAPHSTTLSSIEQIEKYEALMHRQEKSLG